MKHFPHPSTPLIVWFYVFLFGRVMGTSHYLGGPDDVQAAADTQAALQDALQQAQAERRDLWTTEQRMRAAQAARIAAQHQATEVQP